MGLPGIYNIAYYWMHHTGIYCLLCWNLQQREPFYMIYNKIVVKTQIDNLQTCLKSYSTDKLCCSMLRYVDIIVSAENTAELHVRIHVPSRYFPYKDWPSQMCIIFQVYQYINTLICMWGTILPNISNER